MELKLRLEIRSCLFCSALKNKLGCLGLRAVWPLENPVSKFFTVITPIACNFNNRVTRTGPESTNRIGVLGAKIDSIVYTYVTYKLGG